MKNFKVLLIIIVFFTSLFINISNINAKTLGDLKKELKTLERKDAENKNKEAQTEAEIAASKSKIRNYQTKITEGREKIEQAREEIEDLNIEIKQKEEETKELIRFLQIANGENSYLEYVFGATSMADLINRLAIVEQLSNYNKELITEMNALIKRNKSLQVSLSKKQKELESQIDSLEALIYDLGFELDQISDVSISLENQIKAKRELVNYYIDKGCKDNQELTTCVKIPADTGFIRPIAYGIITSNYGWREYNGGETHYGTDIGTGSEGYKIYPTAAGVVTSVLRKTSCGGNIVFVNHIVNGVDYASVYMHLKTINVKVGDVVERESVIGKSGGGKSTYGWDYCTGGPHLHFGLSVGHYKNYSNWVANSFDSRQKVYFPSGWFSSRY